MKETKFNPKTIFWILALVILIAGIFTLHFDFHFQIGSHHTTLSFAHMGAITSGILSMISFGYGSMKNDLPSKLIRILHVSGSLFLLGLAIYYAVTLNGQDVVLPNLESNTESIANWEAQNKVWSNMLFTGQRGFFAFVILQLIFLIYVFLRKKDDLAPRLNTM